MRSLAVLLLAPVLSAQGSVHVVDDGGSGAFTDLQAAIDAAADGDVVLVRAGAYGPFTLAGKGVTVVADAEAEVLVDGPIVVSNVPADALAVLRGLSTGTPSGHGVSIVDCAGAVRIEECALVGQDSPTTFDPEIVFHGALVEGSASVLLARSSLTGGDGANLGLFGYPTDGGAGVFASGSHVAAADCEVRGGDGASSPEWEGYSGCSGGDGFRAFGADLWISGCTAYGGTGGAGGEDFDPWFGVHLCGDGGRGGSGVRIEYWSSAATASSSAVVRSLFTVPGSGGWTFCGTPGEPGVPLSVIEPAQHEIVLLPGAARGAWASSPVRGGANARLYARGEPGDLAFAVLGLTLPLTPLPGQALPLAVLPVGPVIALGTIPPSGLLSFPIPVPPLAVGFGGTTLALQGAALPAGGPGFEIAPFGTITLLESVY